MPDGGDRKENFNKDKDLEKNFASCLGAIRIIKDGWETEAIPEIRGNTTEKTVDPNVKKQLSTQ